MCICSCVIKPQMALVGWLNQCRLSWPGYGQHITPHLDNMHKNMIKFCHVTCVVFSTRCNIYILRLCYDVSVHLSVTEVHWCIIANLGFKFRSQFTAHSWCMWARGKGSSLGRVEGSSHTMLATARPSCWVMWVDSHTSHTNWKEINKDYNITSWMLDLAMTDALVSAYCQLNLTAVS